MIEVFYENQLWMCFVGVRQSLFGDLKRTNPSFIVSIERSDDQGYKQVKRVEIQELELYSVWRNTIGIKRI